MARLRHRLAILGSLSWGLIGAGCGSSSDPAPAGTVNACGFAGDHEPNETRDTATPYTFGTAIAGCVASATDHDFYEFTAPAGDPAGGYAQIALTNVGNGSLDVEPFSALDNSSAGETFGDTPGMSVLTWLALAPGQKYRVDVRDFAGFGAAYKYTLTVTYTKVADTYEPNDTRDAAKPLTAPVAITAFLYTGVRQSGGTANAEYDDWYAVTLPAGTATTKLENVPTDLYGELEVYDSTGQSLDHQFDVSAMGVSVTSAQVVAAGSYFLRVGVFSGAPVGTGVGAVAPDHFTRPYHLSVAVAP